VQRLSHRDKLGLTPVPRTFRVTSELIVMHRLIRGIAAVGGVFLGALGLMFAQGTVVITQPAGNMQQNVIRFRDEFENNYQATRSPIPVFSLLSKAGITPVNISDEAKFAKTAAGKPRVITFSQDGRQITSEGNAVNGVVFPLLFKDKESTVSVDFPSIISAQVDADHQGDNSLKITLTQPLAFHLKSEELGLPVPKDLYLRSIFLSNSLFEYEFSSKSDGGVVYKIKLDLTKQP
jgi:hypothetical protein